MFSVSDDEGEPPKPESLPESRALDQSQRDALQNLLKTLDNKQERQKFVADLRTLIAIENRTTSKKTVHPFSLYAINEGLHAVTSRIVLFFDEFQDAFKRFKKGLRDPNTRDQFLTGFYKVVACVGVAVAIDRLLRMARTPLRHCFVRRVRRWSYGWRRRWIYLGLIEFTIMAIILVGGTLGLSLIKDPTLTGDIMRLMGEHLIWYISLLHILRTLFKPSERLIHTFNLKLSISHVIYKYLRFILTTSMIGIVGGELITLLNGSALFYTALIKTVLLTQCFSSISFIIKVRNKVRQWLLGDDSSNEDALQNEDRHLTARVARTWHIWFIIYILVFGITLYFQTINDLREVIISFSATAFLVTLTYLLVLKMPAFSYGLIHKVVRSFPHIGPRHGLYSIFTSFILGLFIILICLYGAFKIWDIETIDYIFSNGVKPVFTSLLNIFFILLVGVLVWESNEYLIQYIFKTGGRGYEDRVRHQRLVTMMPLVQIIARGFILGIFVIMIFSELKLDVTPLLAGLGVVGIAFSFGSQSLVKDFITGIFILIEDTMNVGDIVQIDSQKGTVEALSLRTVKVRDTAGNLHTLPFSTINRITNMTKNFAYYVLELVLPFDQNVDTAIQAIKRS